MSNQVISPEALVQEWLGVDSPATQVALSGEPLHVPYRHLAGIDGWVVWLGHPPVPDWATLLPVPEALLWGDPHDAIGVSALVAADYAVRRGATSVESARTLLETESPLAVVVPGEVHRSVRASLDALEHAGVPIIRAVPESADELADTVRPFAFRRQVHAADLGRRHDPAISFESIVAEGTIGGNSLSSYVLHNEGEVDQVQITGEIGGRIGIEIGLGGEIPVDVTAELERWAERIPAFLTGLTSERQGNSLAIGWSGEPPTAELIGRAFQLYLGARSGAEFVDVRIAFAPEKGRSALLTDMRARAAAFRIYRDAVIAGDPDPLAAVERYQSTQPE